VVAFLRVCPLSQQGPILIISHAGRPSFVRALDEAKLFPLIEATLSEAPAAVRDVQPAAVVVAMAGAAEADLQTLARETAARKPYVPLLALDPPTRLPENAIPLWGSGANSERLVARLRAGLRLRALHATVLRRLADDPAKQSAPMIDPTRDATALLIGRGGNYPALSVALGERMGVVGALSIEAAASHLNNRDIDGVVLCRGFTPRVVDAFLTVLSEDSRFRLLPITVACGTLERAYDLPNLELISGEPSTIATCALPLIRQHAFETQLNRVLAAIDAGGLIDPQTGLLTSTAFARDFARAVEQTRTEGGGLSVARFVFDPDNPRAQLDGARIISRLKRRTDFGAAHHDGSVLVVFDDTDLREAHAVARRLSSVMRQTSNGRRARSDAVVTVATLLPTDTPKSLLARLYEDRRREAV
jgi:GGDEF domain-containing protein